MSGERPTVTERFWSKVEKGDDCWTWTARTFKDGYGSFYVNRSRQAARAHRFAYELLVGPIPEGLVLDHLCRNRLCVNPAHLEAVTNRENVLRGAGPSAVAARRTSCVNGHEFTDENTRISPEGYRLCLACRRKQSKAWIRATFVCPHCGQERNRSKRERHYVRMHPEVLRSALAGDR